MATVRLGGLAARSALALALLSCSADETTDTGTSSSAGTGPASSTAEGTGGAAPQTYGTSPCGQCVHEACSAAFDGCLADPECPAYAACLDGCPVTADGDADPTCEAACPRGTGSESKRASAAIGACRDPGPGADCDACHVAERPAVPPYEELNQTCEPSPEPDVCQDCQDESCCETQAACNANPECVAARECINAGGDVEQCGIDHLDGVADLALGVECLFYRCRDACGPLDACTLCMQDKCGLEWATHVRTPDGFLLEWCIGKCAVGDTACDQACYDKYPGAVDAYADLGECVVVTGCATGACVSEN